MQTPIYLLRILPTCAVLAALIGVQAQSQQAQHRRQNKVPLRSGRKRTLS